MAKSIEGSRQAIEKFCPVPGSTTVYLAYHNTWPGRDGNASMELLPERFPVLVTAEQDVTTQLWQVKNLSLVSLFPTNPATVFANWVSVWDSATNGNLLYVLQITASPPLQIDPVVEIQIPAGTFILREI